MAWRWGAGRGGEYSTPQWNFPKSLVFLKAFTQLPGAATMESKAKFRGCRNQVSHGSHVRWVQRAGGRGLQLLPTPDDPLWGTPSPATCQALSLGLRSLHAHRTTWCPPGRPGLSCLCLCTCSAPCRDPGNSLPPLSPGPLQWRLRTEPRCSGFRMSLLTQTELAPAPSFLQKWVPKCPSTSVQPPPFLPPALGMVGVPCSHENIPGGSLLPSSLQKSLRIPGSLP